jgi:hypothetical protein
MSNSDESVAINERTNTPSVQQTQFPDHLNTFRYNISKKIQSFRVIEGMPRYKRQSKKKFVNIHASGLQMFSICIVGECEEDK